MTDALATSQLPVIALGADHRGAPLKKILSTWLSSRGYRVIDCGTDSGEARVDAQDYGVAAIKQIKHGTAQLGLLLCGGGIMMSVVANRFPFIRAALCRTTDDVVDARGHNDANVLCLATDKLDESQAIAMLKIFLDTPALGETYARRRARLATLDINQI